MVSHQIRRETPLVFSLVKYFSGQVSSFHQSAFVFKKKLSENWKLLRLRTVRNNYLRKMANDDPSIDTILQPFRESVKQQGDLVRSLKKSNAPEIDLQKAINELKARKKILDEKELALVPKKELFQRVRLEDLLKRRFFIDLSFSIYGGISGLYDFGPMGCAMKHALLNEWRNHFVLEDNLLEVDCSMLTPYSVLKASGHVDRFADLMVKDLKTGECFRLDHLIKAHIEKLMTEKNISQQLKDEYEQILIKLDGFGKEEMNQILRKYNMKSPIGGHDLSDAVDFNLMFSTSIGPTGLIKAFLRPETAQGIFVNFKRLLEFNAGRLPFGAAQIGNAFRNEISPRSGLLRVREFTMAEIEYFVDPANKDHPKFDTVKDIVLNLYSACNQMDGKSSKKVKLGDAVANKIIANETLAYFMARIHSFLLKMGIDQSKLRFRQHMSNEMAHYACDCWDAECLSSFGWVECVGCADRSCYDLQQHTKATGVRLVAEKSLKEPIAVDCVEIKPDKAAIGKEFKMDARTILGKLTSLNEEEQTALEKCIKAEQDYELSVEDKKYLIKPAMVTAKNALKKVCVTEIVPNVIEPSFGIGRIMYCVWEHNFRIRKEDELRTYIAIPPLIAPIKCAVLPLGTNPEFCLFTAQVSNILKEYQISQKIDESSVTLGRRYARADEIAIPFAITIDFDTLKQPHTVTVRERDTTSQIRLPIEDVGQLLKDLCSSKKTWEDAKKLYPVFAQQEASKD